MAAGDTAEEIRHVVILDDEPFMLGLLSRIAERSGFHPRSFSMAQDFLSNWNDPLPDLILLDLGLMDGDGMQILTRLADEGCGVPILIITGFDERVAASASSFGESLGLSMLPTLRKPFEVDEVSNLLRGYASTAFALTGEELAQAIHQRRLEVFYQPIIDIQTRLLVGAEALVRWRHPARGLVPPERFLATAEKSGLIGLMTDEVTKQAFTTLAATEDLSMSVNIAPMLLREERFPDIFAAQARAAGVKPSQIVIELAEQLAMRDAVDTSGVITRLRIKGFRVALDDFGLGYSSLVELHRMPVSQIKIDRSFVTKMGSDESAHTIAGAIIGLGHSLKLQVAAEGVEDNATAVALTQLGCDLAQGFHFAKPMPRDDFLHWARAYGAEHPPTPLDGTVTAFPNSRPRPD